MEVLVNNAHKYIDINKIPNIESLKTFDNIFNALKDDYLIVKYEKPEGYIIEACANFYNGNYSDQNRLTQDDIIAYAITMWFNMDNILIDWEIN